MHYFLGKAANYEGKTAHHFFAHGKKADSEHLKSYLAGRYGAEVKNVALTANGRSALCLAIKSLIPENSEIVINGFTCYAVIQAVREANCTPIFADISAETLNYTPETLENLLKNHKNIRGFIIQNTFSNLVDIKKFESIAKNHNLILIEDLAHCTGHKYPDGREAGAIGDAAAFSFGKDKTLDTITGGAVVIRKDPALPLKNIKKAPHFSSYLRARWYPVFGKIIRACSYVHLGGPLTRLLLKIHWIDRSADHPVDLIHRPAHFQAKLALEQLENMPKNPKPIRNYLLVENRDKLIEKLLKKGFYFNEFWFETPIAPARYYKNSGFNEKDCPVATLVAQKIINLPTIYPKKSLEPALKIIKEHQNGQ